MPKITNVGIENNTGQPSLIELLIDEIDLGKHPLRNPQYAEIEALVGSIADFGVVIPIAVRKIGEQWQLIYGYRRLMAAKQAGRKTIWAFDRTGSDDAEVLWHYLFENHLRKNLNPIRLGMVIKKLVPILIEKEKENDGTL
jgi:ParB family transcriptional regulator, chromosome partitioning protein